MSAKTGRAGAHTSVIDAAAELVAEMEKLGRVSRGFIIANAGARGRAVKVSPLEGCLLVTVVAKGARQEFHAYGISADQLRTLLSGRAYRSFEKNFPEEE